jgi:hypothetical protein
MSLNSQYCCFLCPEAFNKGHISDFSLPSTAEPRGGTGVCICRPNLSTVSPERHPPFIHYAPNTIAMPAILPVLWIDHHSSLVILLRLPFHSSHSCPSFTVVSSHPNHPNLRLDHLPPTPPPLHTLHTGRMILLIPIKLLEQSMQQQVYGEPRPTTAHLLENRDRRAIIILRLQ